MKRLQLNCTQCKEFTVYRYEDDGNGGFKKNSVRCNECGKRHSTKSIYMVDPDRQYERDESGTLIEKVF